MVNFKRLSDQAKNLVEKRGGTDALKADAEELKKIAKGKGSLSDKAKAAAGTLKDPGTKGGNAKKVADAPPAPGPDTPSTGEAKPALKAEPAERAAPDKPA